LVISPDFDSRRSKRIDSLSAELIQILGVIDPALLDKKCRHLLQRNIIEPAVKLAHQINLSTDRFFVQFSSCAHTVSNEKAQDPSIVEFFDCINVLANGKPVKFDSRHPTEARGSITYLLDVLPAFYCQSIKGDTISEPKVLKRPKVLIAVTKPGRERYQGGSRARESNTLLGGIYAKLNRGSRWKLY